MRFQVRKRQGRWEVWALSVRSWVKLEDFDTFRWAMALATGQAPYGPDNLGRIVLAVAK